MISAQKKQHPTPAVPNKPRTSCWSAERRAKQAAAIKRWAPWEKSTGPRTAAGKARAAQNAAKPRRRLDPARVMDGALKLQKIYLLEIKRSIAARKISPQNGLLKAAAKKREAELLRLGRAATFGLILALEHHKLCKTLDFSAFLGQIVNASSTPGRGTGARDYRE